MFLALHLTPGILDPLTPDVFTHSFGDDPYLKELLPDQSDLLFLGFDLAVQPGIHQPV